MAIIKNWYITNKYSQENTLKIRHHLSGNIYNDKNYPDGQHITTEEISSISDTVIITTDGNSYNISSNDVNLNYKQDHPNFTDIFSKGNPISWDTEKALRYNITSDPLIASEE